MYKTISYTYSVFDGQKSSKIVINGRSLIEQDFTKNFWLVMKYKREGFRPARSHFISGPKSRVMKSSFLK